jgi:hypothetical protein
MSNVPVSEVPDNEAFITSTTGVRFRVRILNQGDTYGRTNSVVWISEKPGVEFYDSRYQQPEGQFVSRYYVESLPTSGGLDLFGGVPEWSIDAAAMDVVRTWLRAQTEEKS